jgi:hypothetical protein
MRADGADPVDDGGKIFCSERATIPRIGSGMRGLWFCYNSGANFIASPPTTAFLQRLSHRHRDTLPLSPKLLSSLMPQPLLR